MREKKSMLWQCLEESAEVIRDRLEMETLPETLIILGSGFRGFVDTLADPVRLAVEEIPHFPVPKVAGHGAELVCGRIKGRRVVVLTGRVHMYEGYSPGQVVYPIRSLSTLGIQKVVLTNATGSVDPAIRPGSVAVIRDQINLTGVNCLVEGGSELGPIFLDMSQCYSPVWRENVANKLSLTPATYLGVLGPTYETMAEVTMMQRLGANIVGMSTVQETIAAHQLKLGVLGLSLVTNMAGGEGQKLEHADVVQVVDNHRERLVEILTAACLLDHGV